MDTRFFHRHFHKLYFLFLIAISIIFGALLIRITSIFAANPLDVTTEVYSDYIYVYAESPGSDSFVMSIEYSIDNGNTWIESPAYDGDNPDGGGYGGYWADTYIDQSNIEPGFHDVLIRALDEDGSEWPVGGIIINGYEGSTDSLVFDLFEENVEGTAINVEVYGDYMYDPLNIDSVEYRINDGDWIALNATGYGTEIVQGSIMASEIPQGNAMIELRAFDSRWGLEWPLDGVYPTLTTFIGTQGSGGSSGNGNGNGNGNGGSNFSMGPVFYTEDFENGVGTVIANNGSQNGDFASSIGNEWSINYGSGYGRVRIQGNGYQLYGNGAATLDTPGGGTLSSLDLILTQDLTSYNGSTDLGLHFYYMWHDNQSNGSQINKVYIRSSENDPWVEAYDLTANADLGNYVEVGIDVDALLTTPLTDTFQVRFHMEGAWTADATTFYEGYSIDDLTLGGTNVSMQLPPVIYSQDFENGVGTEYQLWGNGRNLGDSIGAEWYADALTFGASRVRIQGDGFQYTGNGALTLDAFDSSGFIGNADLQLILNVDLRNYQDTDDLLLRFFYMWHDDNNNDNGNAKVWVRSSNDSSWIEAYDLLSTAQLGNYVEVQIDLDQLLTEPVTQTFQIGFTLNTPQKALSPNSYAGYSIDDLTVHGTQTRSISMGPIIYTEDFDTIEDVIDVNTTLDSYIGSEWNAEFTDNGRIRFESSGYERSGTAVVLDSSLDSAQGISDLILTKDMTAYEGADDIALEFYYMWHDIEPYNGQVNKVYIRESNTSSWVEAYDLQAEPVLGGYKRVLIDIDDILTNPLTETFQVKFHYEGNFRSIDVMQYEGFTIDDLSIGATQIVTDVTPPDITFSSQISTYSKSDITIQGIVADNESPIYDVEVLYKNVNDSDYVSALIYADDGDFDSGSEYFTSNLSNLQDGESYDILVRATNNIGLYKDYNFTTTIDAVAPTYDFINLGQEPLDSDTVYYTGTIHDNLSGIESVQFRIYSATTGSDIVTWTDINPDDGSFDTLDEYVNFGATGLPDGILLVFVRVIDNAGNESGYDVDRVILDHVDTTAPDIKLHEVLPSLIHDNTPKITGKVSDNNVEKTSNISQIFYDIDGSGWIPLDPFDGDYDEETEEFNFDIGPLSLGEHTVTIRAIDENGNDTDVAGLNKSTTFTVVEQEEVDSVKAVKTSDFVTHTDHDLIASSNTIWGRGRLRLRQTVEISNFTQILGNQNDHFGTRYGPPTYSDMNIFPSRCDNGYWVSKDYGYFSFVDASGIEYEYQLDADFGHPGLDIDRMVEVRDSFGNCHLWLTSYWVVLGIDFGSSIVDGYDSSVSYILNSDFGMTPKAELIIVDQRRDSYGLYITYADGSVGGVIYLEPGQIGTKSDDESLVYDSIGTFSIDNPVDITIRSSRNEIWISDYNEGVFVLRDNNTPLNRTDDVFINYSAITNNFDVVFDNQDVPILAGDLGVYMILSDNDTFDPNDDNVYLLATPFELGQDVPQRISYFPGDDIVGEYFYITSRNGQITYYGTNNTRTDKLDDEVYVLDVDNGIYPTQVKGMYFVNENTIRAVMERQGVFDLTIQKDFVDQGTAVTDIYSTLEGDYLDLDFIRLDSVDFAYTDGAVTYRVSNDGGFTWKPITIGETVNFDNPGYQLVFAMDLYHGSTPVLTSFRLSYSAYRSDTDRGLKLDVEDEPDTVITNTEFGFRVLVLDELDNPFLDPQNVVLELRRVSDNAVVDTFNIDNIVIQNGEAYINNAKADVLGLHYIYATNGVQQAYSDPINFISPSSSDIEEVTQSIPDFEITNHYVSILDNNRVEICWATNMNSVGFIEYGKQDGIVMTTQITENYDTNHCQEIGDLEVAQYNYKINATSEFLQTDYVDGGFSLTGSNEPISPSTIQSCISIDVDNYRYQNGYVYIPYSTDVETRCTLYYGNDPDHLNHEISDDAYSLSHEDMINLRLLKPEKDVFFKIVCDTQDVLSSCTSYGVVPKEEYQKAFRPVENILINKYTVLSNLVIIDLLMLFALNLLAYPRFVLYAIAWIKDRKKAKKWGIVYDKSDKRPVPFAVVELYDRSGKILKKEVTNIDGKYGFAVDAGKYKIIVKHPLFKLYKTVVAIQGKDKAIAIDISLSKDNKFRNFIKVQYSLRDLLRKINTLLVSLGFVFSIIVILVSPLLINYIIFFLYVLQFALLFIFPNKLKWGYVYNTKTNGRINGAFVRLFKGDKQVDVVMTDNRGRYGFIAKPGKYALEVAYPNYELDSSKDGLDIVKLSNGRKGILVNITKNKDMNTKIPLRNRR